MPKTIQWNKEFKDEVLEAKTGTLNIAVRPGKLYFETEYYKKGDIVDVRIGNFVVRKAMIQEPQKLVQLKDLTPYEYNLLKNDINTKEKLKCFLEKKYNLTLDDTSEITVITYNNMNLVDMEENNDPHFC